MFEPALTRHSDNCREPLQQDLDSDNGFVLVKPKETPAAIKRSSGHASNR